jgi:hypothetical protein
MKGENSLNNITKVAVLVRLPMAFAAENSRLVNLNLSCALTLSLYSSSECALFKASFKGD